MQAELVGKKVEADIFKSKLGPLLKYAQMVSAPVKSAVDVARLFK